jgi:hypothetical protein
MATGYYRVGDKYFDNTGQQLYRCITAGDKTSSVWVPISGGATTAFYFLGLWNALATYSQWDQVQLGAGTSAGIYMSTINNNTGNSPDSGIGWVQISSYATWL